MPEQKNAKRKRFSAAPLQRNSCERCGVCCRKGGPALHAGDADGIRDGRILLKFLFTIRKGEPVYDNIRGQVRPAMDDIIKIKSRPNSSICIFYNLASTGCGIYPHRPLECRLLTCWDTEAITEWYQKERLTRKELVAEINGLWELISAHQERCSYDRLARTLESKKGADPGFGAQEILEMVHYDEYLREEIPKKSGIDTEILEFLLGRPMRQTVRMFGIHADKANSGTEIFPAPKILRGTEQV
ncbi:MAG: YkgJ family cysteine cluster protein [Thermodesulfobacteriota bacterium]